MRIGVMGSPAGSHLAASAATQYDPSNAAGKAMNPGQGNASNWPKRVEEWLRYRNLIVQ